MLTCRKTYSDIPFAHRQHLHDGHCAFVHGHNWDISITFGCEKTDENGFVVDFGKLKFIKEWLNANLDHACVFAEFTRLARPAPCFLTEYGKPFLLFTMSAVDISRQYVSAVTFVLSISPSVFTRCESSLIIY